MGGEFTEARRIAASLASLTHSGVAILEASPQLNPVDHLSIDIYNTPRPMQVQRSPTVTKSRVISSLESNNKFSSILYQSDFKEVQRQKQRCAQVRRIHNTNMKNSLEQPYSVYTI